MDDPVLWSLPMIGLIGGFLSGLLGLGGGVVLLPLLTWVGKVPLRVATGTTLVQVMIAAATGWIAHYRGGMVNLSMGLVLGISGVAGGLVGSFLSVYLSIRVLEFIFLFVVGGAIALLFAQGKLYDDPHPREGFDFNKVLGSSIGFGVGSLTGLLGVGGGFVVIPLMIRCLGLPLRVAIGTSLMAIFISSVGTLVVKYNIGQVHLLITLLVISGSTVGAWTGAYVSRRTPVDLLRMSLLTMLALIFLVVGYKVIL